MYNCITKERSVSMDTINWNYLSEVCENIVDNRIEEITLEEAENLYKNFKTATIYHNGKIVFEKEEEND